MLCDGITEIVGALILVNFDGDKLCCVFGLTVAILLVDGAVGDGCAIG